MNQLPGHRATRRNKAPYPAVEEVNHHQKIRT